MITLDEAVAKMRQAAESVTVPPLGASLPVSQELLDDAVAIQRGLILSTNPMMGEARLEYWMRRGGWSAFALFQMRKHIQDRG